MSNIDLRLFSLCRRLGLPPTAARRLIRGRRALRHPLLYARRRGPLPPPLAASPWRRFIPPDLGFARFERGEMPGLEEVIEACRAVHRERAASLDPALAKKPFFANILEDADLDRHDCLMRFALSDPVLAAVAGYLDSVPRFKGLGLYYSRLNQSTVSSQLFHLDHDDDRQIKCFVNVLDVGAENGPFTFMPRPQSSQVLSHCRHLARNGRFRDDDVLAAAGPAGLQVLAGPAGSGAFVDTSNCLHFGSRARGGERLVFMFQYTTFPDYRLDKGKEEDGLPLHEFEPARFAADSLRRLILSPPRGF